MLFPVQGRAGARHPLTWHPGFRSHATTMAQDRQLVTSYNSAFDAPMQRHHTAATLFPRLRTPPGAPSDHPKDTAMPNALRKPDPSADTNATTENRTQRYLLAREIAAEDAFRFRQIGIHKEHVRGLVQTLRATGDLDPVLVWQEVDDEGHASGRFVLLDGHHRLAAYATAKGLHERIPAVVLQGDRSAAMLEAVKANSRDTLPLTKTERTDAAWALVRLPGKRLTVKIIAAAAGVGAATVDRMRKRLKVMMAESKTPSGQWWRDSKIELPEMTDRPEMTDAERLEQIERYGKAIREALGRLPWKDEHLAAEALMLAVGRRKLLTMAEFLFGDDEFDTDTRGGTFAEPIRAAETEAADF